jgi:hypothetical protein
MYHYTTLLANGVVTISCTWGGAVADYLENRALNLSIEGEPSEVFRRRQDMLEAAEYLRANYAEEPVRIVCEVQFILKSFLDERKSTHGPYKVLRCHDQKPETMTLDVFPSSSEFTLEEETVAAGEMAGATVPKSLVQGASTKTFEDCVSAEGSFSLRDSIVPSNTNSEIASQQMVNRLQDALPDMLGLSRLDCSGVNFSSPMLTMLLSALRSRSLKELALNGCGLGETTTAAAAANAAATAAVLARDAMVATAAAAEHLDSTAFLSSMLL